MGPIKNGMKMDKRRKKELTLIMNQMDYINRGMKMDKKKVKQTGVGWNTIQVVLQDYILTGMKMDKKKVK